MDKIKLNINHSNKHFVWGISFVFFSLITSIVWGLTYASEEEVPVPVVPASPSNFTGVVNNNSVSLSWTNNSTNQDKFNISRRTNGSPSLISIALVSGSSVTSYTDNSVTAGNTYDYQVEACLSGTGCSPMVEITGIVVPSSTDNTPLAPSAPSGFEPYTTLTSSMTVIPLKWIDNSNNETSFVIEKKLSTISTYMSLTNLNANATFYTDSSSIVRDVSYDYRIKACLSGQICSDYVYLLNIKIPPVTTTTNSNNTSGCTGLNLVLKDGKTTYTIGQSVNYTWSCIPAGSVGTVSIWLNKPDGAMVNYNSGSGSSTQTMGFSTSNLIPGQYILKACLGTSCTTSGTTIATQIFNVITPVTSGGASTSGASGSDTTSTAPSAPSGFEPYTTLTSSMTVIPLKWIDNSNNETSFVIEKKLSTISTYVPLITLGANIKSYIDSSVVKGTSYDYRIKACLSSSLCSPYVNLSEIKIPTTTTVVPPSTVTTAPTTETKSPSTTYVPKMPTNLSLAVPTTYSSKDISLKWIDNAVNEDKFNIERKLRTATTWSYLKQIMGSNITTYLDTTAVPGVIYDYRVQACLSGTGCSDFTTLSNIMIPVSSALNVPPTTVNNSTCTGLSLTLKDGKTTYTIGQSVNYTWSCIPVGSVGTVSIWLNKPDGAMVNYNSGSGSSTQTMGFSTSNLIPGQYILKACLGTSCTTSGTTIATQIFKVITSSPTVPPTVNPVIEKPVAPIVNKEIISTDKPIAPTSNTNPIIPVTDKVVDRTTNTTTEYKDPLIQTQQPLSTAPENSLATNSDVLKEVKAPAPLESPKDIIENVTAVLNIIKSELPLETKTENLETETPKEQIKEEVKEEINKEEIVELVYKDTNKDGISDYDSKYVYNIDPIKPSFVSTYENKKITAGEKILLGFDPTKKELTKVVAEEPTTIKSEMVVDSYKVREVALTEKKEVVLKGQALPNSFITLYIYSTPIMVVVKTDSNGEWEYVMDKELEDGNHTIYTATVNNTGNIVAKSTPFTFVKTAEAVALKDIIPAEALQEEIQIEKPGFLQTKNVLVIVIGILMLAGLTLILIGLFSKKTNQEIVS